MSKFSLVVLFFAAIFLWITTPFATAFPLFGRNIAEIWKRDVAPMDGPIDRTVGEISARLPLSKDREATIAESSETNPEGSSVQKRCLIGRFACFGRIAEPVYRVAPPVVASSPENIILNNKNEINIVAPKVVVPAITREHILKEKIAMTFTEVTPITILSSVTERVMATETLPAQTVVMNNFYTMTEVNTVPVIERVMATQTLLPETVVMTNFATVTEVATASVTESVFATQTLPAETVVMDNYHTLTNVETASVTERVFATQTLPAETVVMNNYVTLTDVSTVLVTDRVTAMETLPAQTVVTNNFFTVTQVETSSVIHYAVPSPTPYGVLVEAPVPVAAPCQEMACMQVPACVSENIPCT